MNDNDIQEFSSILSDGLTQSLDWHYGANTLPLESLRRQFDLVRTAMTLIPLPEQRPVDKALWEEWAHDCIKIASVMNRIIDATSSEDGFTLFKNNKNKDTNV